MFQNDVVTLQTKTVVNTTGSVKNTWVDNKTVVCDVQDINKEIVNKAYGFSSASEYKQVFDLNITNVWKKSFQVKYKGEQYTILLANENMGKLKRSNHIFIILGKVI